MLRSSCLRKGAVFIFGAVKSGSGFYHSPLSQLSSSEDQAVDLADGLEPLCGTHWRAVQAAPIHHAQVVLPSTDFHPTFYSARFLFFNFLAC